VAVSDITVAEHRDTKNEENAQSYETENRRRHDERVQCFFGGKNGEN
jgi:hypothetical protein